MTFQQLIDIHRRSLRNPVPTPPGRRNRVHKPPARQVFTDWASI